MFLNKLRNSNRKKEVPGETLAHTCQSTHFLLPNPPNISWWCPVSLLFVFTIFKKDFSLKFIYLL